VELKLNCGYLLGVCYFGLPVEPRLIFSLPLLELLLKRLKRNAKIICDGILMDMRSTATGARRSFSQESEAFSLKKPKAESSNTPHRHRTSTHTPNPKHPLCSLVVHCLRNLASNTRPLYLGVAQLLFPECCVCCHTVWKYPGRAPPP
jgi:hypothetical protein